MFAGITVLIACIAAAVVLTGVVLLLVMLGRQDHGLKNQPDPWQEGGAGHPPPPAGPSPYDHPDAGAPHGQPPPGSGPAGPPAQGH